MEPPGLLELYALRYETLLQITRLAMLAFPVVFVWLTLTGRSSYPRWVAVLSPILLMFRSPWARRRARPAATWPGGRAG